jgi:hypothetical protein
VEADTQRRQAILRAAAEADILRQQAMLRVVEEALAEAAVEAAVMQAAEAVAVGRTSSWLAVFCLADCGRS